MNRRLPLLAWLLLASLMPAATGEQGTLARDQAAVVSAYLFNFGRFVEWPAAAFTSDRGAFRFCVYGTDLLGSSLDDLSEKRLHERAIETARLRRGDAISACHVLYISESESFYVNRILEQNEGFPVLMVSRIPGFADKGGTVGLVTIDNKLRFEINKGSAERSGLTVSSQLLKLAQRVLNEGGS